MEQEYRDMTVEEFKAAVIGGEKDFRYVRLPEYSNLTGAYLDEEYCNGLPSERDFEELDLSKIVLEGAVFIGANLSGVNLSGANLERINLSKANLSFANLPYVNLTKANLEGARLMGANFEKAKLTEANLSKANLVEVNLSNSSIVGAILKEVNMENANLIKADLQSTDFSGAHAINANLVSSNLISSYIVDANFYNANLKMANMTSANLSRSNFERANFFGVTLKTALLIGTILKSSDIRNANLSESYMDETNIENAKIPDYRICHYLGMSCSYTDYTSIQDYSNIKCGSTVLKREIDDLRYVQEYQKEHPFLSLLWWISSECGRNLALWVMWCFIIAVSFGAVFADYHCPEWLKWAKKPLCAINPDIGVNSGEGLIRLDGTPIYHQRDTNGFTPYYFSIVTFTTLGFGDIQPLNTAGEIWLSIEVILGYIMLGGLISILANKLARRT